MGFGNQGNRRNQPGRNNRRPGRRPQPRPGGPGGGGGGLFSKIGQGFKSVTSSVGKGLKNVTGSVGKAVSGINPLSALKKGLTSNAGKFIGKAAKGGLIGALLNVGSLASILAGDGTPQQKAEQIIPLAASIIGGSLGSIAGSIVPVVGTIGGGVLGGLIGDYIGNIPAIQKALAPPLAKVLGGDDVAEDFIMQGGKIQKFRKDDIVMGGTNLTGSDPKMIQLLERLIAAVEKGGIVTLDGQKVGTALNIGAYRLQ
jgi:phage tail tape-measure protein